MAAVDQQYALWVLQKAERLRLGDDLSAARPVEHFVYFNRKSRALAAADSLVDLGFGVSTRRVRFKTLVYATRPETLTDENVLGFLGEVVAMAESHGGDYDGWGAETTG